MQIFICASAKYRADHNFAGYFPWAITQIIMGFFFLISMNIGAGASCLISIISMLLCPKCLARSCFSKLRLKKKELFSYSWCRVSHLLWGTNSCSWTSLFWQFRIFFSLDLHDSNTMWLGWSNVTEQCNRNDEYWILDKKKGSKKKKKTYFKFSEQIKRTSRHMIHSCTWMLFIICYWFSIDKMYWYRFLSRIYLLYSQVIVTQQNILYN